MQDNSLENYTIKGNKWKIISKYDFSSGKNPDYFDKYLIKSSSIHQNIKFIGYSINSSITNTDYKKRMLDRILFISNKLNNNMLPEIVDYVSFNESENKDNKILIMEYFDDETLLEKIQNNNLSLNFKSKKRKYPSIKYLASGFFPRLINFLTSVEKIENQKFSYIGLFPEHIYYLGNEHLKIKGFRYFCHTSQGFINDEWIKQPDLYGGLYREDYLTPEVISCLEGNSQGMINPKHITAYQLGILLLDIYTHGKEKGNLRYENIDNLISTKIFNHVKLKDLIKDLTNPNPEQRLIDYDKIILRFAEFIN